MTIIARAHHMAWSTSEENVPDIVSSDSDKLQSSEDEQQSSEDESCKCFFLPTCRCCIAAFLVGIRQICSILLCGYFLCEIVLCYSSRAKSC